MTDPISLLRLRVSLETVMADGVEPVEPSTCVATGRRVLKKPEIGFIEIRYDNALDWTKLLLRGWLPLKMGSVQYVKKFHCRGGDNGGGFRWITVTKQVGFVRCYVAAATQDWGISETEKTFS